ncbi:MAG: sigma-70 family RNA polymerase sigma factor [Sporocytophaga sp.]|nr:sigma-70 family RNA polymerase sigma factor [Sporocytophaga sp.]
MKDNLSKYFKEIKKFNAIEAEEELRLIENIRQGDLVSREKLIKAHLGFVVKTARKYQRIALQVPLVDLISEGNMGILYAVQKFKPEMNVRFLTYGAYWIKKFIQRYICIKGSLVHLPVHKGESLNKIRKAIKYLEVKTGEKPYADEIAEYLKIPEEVVCELLVFEDTPLTFDSYIKDANKADVPIFEMLPEDTFKSGESALVYEEERKRLEYLLSQLTLKQREVMELYYGINVDSSYNMEEIAKRLNISAERVRQLKEAGLKKLQTITGKL